MQPSEPKGACVVIGGVGIFINGNLRSQMKLQIRSAC